MLIIIIVFLLDLSSNWQGFGYNHGKLI